MTIDKTTPPEKKKPKGVIDATLDYIGDRFLEIPKKPREERLAKLTAAQKQELLHIEENAIADFSGQLDELESALGMLRMGHHYGWKVLYLIHSKRTVRKYEDILGIKIRELFPETGPGSYRSYGFIWSQKYSNFWKVAGGDIKIPDRKKVE